MALKNIIIFLLILPIIVSSGCTSQNQINGKYTGQLTDEVFDNKIGYAVYDFHSDGTVTMNISGIINGYSSLVMNSGKWVKNGDHYEIILDNCLPGMPEKIFFSYDPDKDAISFPDSQRRGYIHWYSGTLFNNWYSGYLNNTANAPPITLQ
jgi:hypothetical protein